MTDSASPSVSQELTSTIISLQETIRNVRSELEKEQQEFTFDPTQPIGHLLDSTPANEILSLAKPTSETLSDLNTLGKKLHTLQQTLTARSQWHPTTTPRAPIPCSTAFLDLSDLTTAVNLLSEIVTHSNPATHLTPHQSLASKKWTWDPLWREFYSPTPSSTDEPSSTMYLSRWYFDPAREVWVHANMAHSALLPDEAQFRLGSWTDWVWDCGAREWGLDVSAELSADEIERGAKLWVFASRWVESESGWVYVGGRGG